MRSISIVAGLWAMLLAPSSANAATNYFICKITLEGKSAIVGDAGYRITTDDEKNEVTYEVLGNGNIFKRPAIFTPDSVVWESAGADSIMRTQWTISRVDLTFGISVYIGGKVVSPRTGTCTKIEAPRRRF